MDSTGLIILLRELVDDGAVASAAARKATQRLEETSGGRLEACAYELARFYNILERMFERLCEEFENHFEKRGDFHEKLLQRVSLELEGIRPAFLPRTRLEDVRELKGFRHLMRHAYDLTLKEERLKELALIARKLAGELPEWSENFVRQVRKEQGWNS